MRKHSYLYAITALLIGLARIARGSESGRPVPEAV